MREYNLKTFSTLDWNSVEKAEIDTFKWVENDYKPECFAQCALTEAGLHIKLTAYENSPRAVCENFGDPVCTDSCLEFFACFDNESDKYVNFEMNSKGTMLATLRGPGCPIVPINEIIEIPQINAIVDDAYWSVEFLLTSDQITALFPNAKIEKGGYFTANFYKCGDMTEQVHYGMWNEVMGDPNFHLPQYFGKVNIC